MASTDVGRPDLGEMKLHRSQRGGSIGLVLLIAVVLVGAAVGLLQVGRGNTSLYILILLAILGITGVAYPTWLRFVWPLVLKLMVFGAIVMIVAVQVGLR